MMALASLPTPICNPKEIRDMDGKINTYLNKSRSLIKKIF
jgi:hypothetical protein